MLSYHPCTAYETKFEPKRLVGCADAARILDLDRIVSIVSCANAADIRCAPPGSELRAAAEALADVWRLEAWDCDLAQVLRKLSEPPAVGAA